MNRPQTVFSLSEKETYELGQAMARGLRGGEVIVLEGDLGLGKTVMVRGLAAGLGVAPEDVHSPSYMLVQEYSGGRVPMFHVDLYRLTEEADTEEIGIDEISSGGGVVVVEWGERLPRHLRRDAIHIRLHDIGEDSRRIELGSFGSPMNEVADAIDQSSR
ncbi:MAG: tRNA (adenosine(37)-N6)-threonylcarbamoyltransferase complex ATPase subunit type 1 TsaE [Acidobacteriota bacterium]|nr:tRNA (adenosine(37)-N6)-threonylcarbamoyltransferase complex ATPase subunit type 1 TsaE [Acidobacteriota bacterium]MDH3786310.1 tRNA (adenosine(37)-N6)-threonylcarbamoyltransferase complex ATPase subunit type 1 TsaE [Acidobacteriota bacterium]